MQHWPVGWFKLMMGNLKSFTIELHVLDTTDTADLDQNFGDPFDRVGFLLAFFRSRPKLDCNGHVCDFCAH
jgi:hypothetical protein